MGVVAVVVGRVEGVGGTGVGVAAHTEVAGICQLHSGAAKTCKSLAHKLLFMCTQGC